MLLVAVGFTPSEHFAVNVFVVVGYVILPLDAPNVVVPLALATLALNVLLALL